MNIEVKRIFVLADWMKAAERCDSEEDFRSLLSSEEIRVAGLLESELDQVISRSESRLKRFEELDWTLDEITLADCAVWDRMGDRPWAVGTVREVADKFLRMEPSGSRVWRMKLFASIFSSQLPLIIVHLSGKFAIDDGSHRAIAMRLAGIKKAKAYVGAEKKRVLRGF